MERPSLLILMSLLIITATSQSPSSSSNSIPPPTVAGLPFLANPDDINYRINNLNFNNADNSQYDADLLFSQGKNPSATRTPPPDSDPYYDSSYFDQTSKLFPDTGIARLSKSSVESNMLFDEFFGPNANYSKYVLPKQKIVGKAVTVGLLLTLIQLGDVDERNQIMSTMIWVNHEWQDVSLSWDPNKYGGLKMLHIPSDLVWIPDTVLYNNADGDYQLSTRAKVTVHHTGVVRWEPPAIYRSFCLIDVTYFPFDDQSCDLKLGPWTFDVHVVNYVHLRAPHVDFLGDAIDRSRYFESVEWEIISAPGKRNEVYYTGLTEGYVDITYTLLLRRKALFYTVNLIAPCLAISLLTIFVFYLPSESGEKVTLSISILLSLTFFIILLADLIPPTSLIVPLIGKYLLFTMTLVTLSIISTVIVLSVFQNPMNTLQPLPVWVRYTFLRILPKLLFMQLRKVEKSVELVRLEHVYNAELCRQQLANSDLEDGEDDRFKKMRMPPPAPQVERDNTRRLSAAESGFFAMKSHNSQRPPHHQRNRVYPPFFSSAVNSDVFGNKYSPTGSSTERDQYDAVSMTTAGSVTSSLTYSTSNPYYYSNKEDGKGGFIYVKRQFIKTTLNDVASIVEYCREEEKETLLRKEWETVARVLDRLFLILYSCSCIFGILTILLSAPSLWGVEHKAMADFRNLAAAYPFNKSELLTMAGPTMMTAG